MSDPQPNPVATIVPNKMTVSAHPLVTVEVILVKYLKQ